MILIVFYSAEQICHCLIKNDKGEKGRQNLLFTYKASPATMTKKVINVASLQAGTYFNRENDNRSQPLANTRVIPL